MLRITFIKPHSQLNLKDLCVKNELILNKEIPPQNAFDFVTNKGIMLDSTSVFHCSSHSAA